MTWVFDQDIKPSSRKFVLLSLADCASDHDNCAFPSISTLVRKTSLDRKTVIDSLHDLIKRGLLVDTGRKVGTTLQVRVFLLPGLKDPENGPVQNIPVLPTKDPTFTPKDPTFSGKDPVFPHKGSQKRDTDPSVTISTEPSVQPSVTRGRMKNGVLIEVESSKVKGSIEQVKAFCVELDLPESDGDWFFWKCEGNAWRNGTQPIKDWKATIRAWKVAGYLPSQKNGKGPNGAKSRHFAEIDARRADQLARTTQDPIKLRNFMEQP